MRRVGAAQDEERGATVAEYAVLLGLLGVALLAATYALGLSLFGTLQDASDVLADPASVLGSSVTGPGGGAGDEEPPSGEPVPVELAGVASTDGATWTATVSVTASGPEGVVVVAVWETDDGASGASTCTLAVGGCTLVLPAFGADTGGPTLVTVTVSSVGDAPADGPSIVVARP